jgi:hypothetical protein
VHGPLPERTKRSKHPRPDMYKAALQDVASIAGLLITTEAMVAEKPKKETAPAMPPGGMDY